MRFTVRRPPIGEVSTCGHRPSGGDVLCSVDVGVAPAGSAGLALENRLALAVAGSDVPARRASLRRIGGRDLLDPTVGLVLQARGEQPPTAATDRPVQSALLSNTHTRLLDSSPRSAGHRPHVEGFDPDRVEAARNFSGGFLDPVLAPVGLTGLQFRDRRFVRARRLEPRLARASRCCSTFNRLASPAVRLGACSSSPVDSAADTATPRSMPTTLPSRARRSESGMWANATCQRPARSRVTR